MLTWDLLGTVLKLDFTHRMLPWDSHGDSRATSMGSPWNFDRATVHPWGFHGDSVGLPFNFYGTSRGFP